MHNRGLELIFYGTSPQHFKLPVETLIARTPAEAAAALEQVDRLHAEGFAVAGYLSYELGYAHVALAPSPQIAATQHLPYLVLGAFEYSASAPIAVVDSEKPFQVRDMRAAYGFEEYERACRNIARRLHAGDVYQTNFTVPHDFTYSGDPAAGFASLYAQTGAPYAAYLHHAACTLLSLSPELFLRFEPGRITTKPMKGTASLHAVEELSSAKNHAEHLMIVDLLRNDLSIVGDRVEVQRLFELETYATFATLTSTISARVKCGTRFGEIVRALFPCGSVTGAPKRAAMQTIAALEQRARDAYCGSIGYLLPDGHGEWNVAIRTAQLDTARGTGRLDLGGGIVADSTPADEWRELQIKGRFFDAVKL